jgi:hypothetical protein
MPGLRQHAHHSSVVVEGWDDVNGGEGDKVRGGL